MKLLNYYIPLLCLCTMLCTCAKAQAIPKAMTAQQLAEAKIKFQKLVDEADFVVEGVFTGENELHLVNELRTKEMKENYESLIARENYFKTTRIFKKSKALKIGDIISLRTYMTSENLNELSFTRESGFYEMYGKKYYVGGKFIIFGTSKNIYVKDSKLYPNSIAINIQYEFVIDNDEEDANNIYYELDNS
jgi:hypothetical protein